MSAGVDTIEALRAAAQAFDATPLGLRVDPDAEAAVEESLRRTGLVLLGEMHSVAETPALEELIAWFGLGGIRAGVERAPVAVAGPLDQARRADRP